jgi:hypothetical protein
MINEKVSLPADNLPGCIVLSRQEPDSKAGSIWQSPETFYIGNVDAYNFTVRSVIILDCRCLLYLNFRGEV